MNDYDLDKIKIIIANKYARYKGLSHSFYFNSINERAALCNDLDRAGIRYSLKTLRKSPIYRVLIED